MKILVFSDVLAWYGYASVVDSIKPDIVALAGDLVYDGFAPGYWEISLEGTYNLDIHIELFYSFLKVVGSRYKVLIVKGNHDEEVGKAYSPDKIDSIPRCMEISGKLVDVEGFSFLGLGFSEASKIGRLKQIIKRYEDKVDIILMHGGNLHTISLIKPKVIIKGGYAPSIFSINGVPALFNGPDHCGVVEFKDEYLKEITLYRFMRIKGRIILKKVENPGIPYPFKDKEWVKPYEQHPSRGG